MKNIKVKQFVSLILILISALLITLIGACSSTTEKFFTVTYTTDGNGTLQGATSQTVEYGKNAAAITAIPNDGYIFVQWSDGVTTATRTDKAVKENKTVTAQFQAKTYTVTYTTDGNGMLQGATSQTVEYGKNAAAVTAIPNDGYIFVQWSDGVTTATRTDKAVKENKTVIAEFQKKTYQISYTTDGNGTLQGKATQTVEYGANASAITAIPNDGYIFVQWSDGVTTATRTDKAVKENKTVTAEFQAKTYTVAYTTDGNGMLQGKATQTVEYGANAAAITAIPNDGYIFVQWSDGITTATRTDKTVKENKTVTAEFQAKTYQITYTTDGNGMLQGKATQTVEYGENAAAVTAIPNDGYIFVQWSDGVTTATRTDKAVKENKTVIAEFQKKTYQVSYKTDNYMYGVLKEENAKYDDIKLDYQIAHGENAPVVKACPKQTELNEDYVFLYWSDGLTSEERQDTNITEPLTVTAYFGYKIVYRVNGNIGGKIVGDLEQQILPDGASKEVTAVPAAGYAFCGWSDLLNDSSRSGDVIEQKLRAKNACWEYLAYFEPTSKTFHYDYGIASGNPVATQITLDRNDIHSAEFVVPSYAGYEFCGWYADSDFRIKIANEKGRYMQGYAAFTMDSDTLYARWQKAGQDPDNHKILLVFVDEVQTEIYESSVQQYIKVNSKMTTLDYEMSKWVTDKIYGLLTEWFAGEVVFEVDAYYTTEIVKDGFDGPSLKAPDIKEITTLTYDYHNTITLVNLYDYNKDFFQGVGGLAQLKNACVFSEKFFQYAGDEMNQAYLQKCKNGDVDLEKSVIRTCLHELTHTAEMNYKYEKDYGLHDAIDYIYKEYGDTNTLNTIKLCLLGKFIMDGVQCGVPMEYWKHRIPVRINYSTTGGFLPGSIVFSGETVVPPDYIDGWDKLRFVAYGGEITLEAVPNKGFHFVKWTDGVTTAIRHDANIISHFSVGAIFEKD